ncbi:MAG: nucleotidyl transferase AbiEii/AbiGii toxin family protein [Oligoflexia bacterium]|nr:nucleotidyl transferase AbiEii/AbiGii toxin family protein [Oligoflexia bacterium]
MAIHPAIESMIKRYNCKTKMEYKSALKEIIQEIILLGLSRHGFFERAAFYGGSALRIAHKLDRFSEDLDFELRKKDLHFDISSFIKGIDEELLSFGLKLTTNKKKKINVNLHVESAFVKGNTLENLLLIEGIDNPSKGINKNDQICVKVEIDVNPPNYQSSTEIKYHNYPISFEYQILDLPSLFAGKLHAILCRNWRGDRVKGRDYYDFLWYHKHKIIPNLKYLEAKFLQTQKQAKIDAHVADKKLMSNVDLKKDLKQLLLERISKVNWQQAIQDVEPFVNDNFALKVWNSKFFSHIIEEMV